MLSTHQGGGDNNKHYTSETAGPGRRPPDSPRIAARDPGKSRRVDARMRSRRRPSLYTASITRELIFHACHSHGHLLSSMMNVDINSRTSASYRGRRSCFRRCSRPLGKRRIPNNKVWFNLRDEPISLRHYHQSTTLKHLARFREGLFSFGVLAFVCPETGERLAPFAIPLSFSRFCPLLHRGSIYSQNQLGLRDVSSILFPSEHPEYSDSRPMDASTR